MPNNARRRTDARYRLGRNGPLYEAARAACFARETHCFKCGEYVDQTIPYRDPVTGKVNIWARHFGHTDELDRPYTNPLDGHLEHAHCNTSAGATYGNRKRAGTLGPTTDTSYDWS